MTLCFNDWCVAQVMIADGQMDRVGRLVLVSCEAFEVEVADSYTLMPEDQPAALAVHLRQFINTSGAEPTPPAAP